MQITERNAVATPDQQRFYEILFGDAEKYIEIRLIDSKRKTKQVFLTHSELLHYPTPQDVNVYVGVFQRGRKWDGTIESCTTTNVIYLDFDGGMELEEVLYRIDNMGLPTPSMIVSSGHGYHVYWLLDEPVGHEVKPVIKKMQEVLNADPQAVDIARVLRVPDTMNVKGEPVPCRLLESRDSRTSLEVFENIFGVKAHIEPESRTGAVSELLEIHSNGLNNMANGVKKGERNFACGRIVQTLKRLNYTKQQAIDIVFKWNTLNSPRKETAELRKEIHTFWHDERYKYDGKEFSEGHLQELNSRFLDDKSTFFGGIVAGTHSYDNELLKPEHFQKTNGLTFAILSIIKLAESEGIRREHIADLCKRDKTDKNVRLSLKVLEEMKHIRVVKKGQTNFYIFTEKAYGKRRGYTSVSKSLHRSFLYGELKEHEYKLMILLESYAFDDKYEIYPSNLTLAFTAGQTERNIRGVIKQLEHKQFIKVEMKKGKRWIRFIYR